MTTPKDEQIPAGYLRDAQGRLIPEKMIRPIDRQRDDLVRELIEGARVAREVLLNFKRQAFADIAAHVSLSVGEYGVKRGGKKGNVTLVSFDGRYKVIRAVQESVLFDERLHAAKALIDECLLEWTANARPEVIALVQDAFKADSDGNLSVARVLGLHRLQFDDERWQRALRAIDEAIHVVGSKSYVRLYERVGDSDRYQPIALNIAEV